MMCANPLICHICCMYDNLVSKTIFVLKISSVGVTKDLSNQADVLKGGADVMPFLGDKSLRTSHKV